MSQKFITATYEVPWAPDLIDRAEKVAVGMTVGSWTDLPATRQRRLRDFLGEVAYAEQIGERGRFAIRYPIDNVLPHLASLLIVIFGKISLDGRIRLVGLELPQSYVQNLPGPAFGIDGLRRRLNVDHRPLVMSIFKSENGRTLKEFGEAFQEQIDGGVDLVKDDEIFFYDREAPLLDRARLTRDLLAAREAATGQPGIYAANLAVNPAALIDTAWTAYEAGVEAFLVSPYAMGLDTLTDLRRQGPPAVWIAHPAFAGGMVAPHGYGVAPDIYFGLLPRLAGADIVLYPSPYGTVAMDREDALAVARQLRTAGSHAASWPGPSAGVHAGMLAQIKADFGKDLVINAGGAIHGHPEGTRAGARYLVDSVAQLWRDGAA